QAGAAGFIDDSKITLGVRNFYINTDNRDLKPSATSNTRSKNAEWGQGFDLRFISGFTQGTVGFGLDAIGLYGVRLDSSRADHGNYTGT
ncbi:outer membrane porin, OprD family, partial [Lactobacillus curvatus]|nr:outer membrane porin, OprD family [Latilactobacillus curvatus]